MIDDNEVTLVESPLSQVLTRDGKSIKVDIYHGGDEKWILEIVDEFGTSTVWEGEFKTDQDALAYLHQTIDEEGIDALIGQVGIDAPMNQNTSEPSEKLNLALSDKEMDELSEFLLSDATSDEAMMLDTLDGFLTAILSGPVTLMTSQWLPRVWGPSSKDEPVFESFEQAMRITGLILRHMNSINTLLQHDPDHCEPVFDIFSIPDDTKDYVDGKMWAKGYLMGINLALKEWDEFFNNSQGAEVLRPIYLLGSDDLSDEDALLTETPEQREVLSEAIPAAIAWIYRFWQPYRQAIVERFIASTYQREHPKVGRNEACPCGSGKKFKKCCGAATVLH